MKPKIQRLKQPTPVELTDALLDFIRRKFYADPGDEKRFLQDRSRLLAWVVLWPADWLNKKGVTIHGEAYRSIFMKTMLQADAYRASRIKYRPAWLREVIQKHFAIHGEEYYEEAKSVRSLVEQTLLLTGKPRVAAPDPIQEMAKAHEILASHKPRKATPKPVLKPAVKEQLTLL